MTQPATILLVRHGMCDPVGKFFAGRMPGVPLNVQGRDEAERVAERIATVPIAAIISSPIQRARETAAAIAAHTNVDVQIDDAFTELDVGAWTGRTFRELGEAPFADDWRRFNTFRSGTRAGGAELMLDAQVRAVGALLALRDRYPGQRVVVVSHGDVIRGAIAYFIGVPLDLARRLEIATGSISTLTLSQEDARLLGLNDTGGVAH